MIDFIAHSCGVYTCSSAQSRLAGTGVKWAMREGSEDPLGPSAIRSPGRSYELCVRWAGA